MKFDEITVLGMGHSYSLIYLILLILLFIAFIVVAYILGDMRESSRITK